jgi:hypothetical protein
MDQQNLVLIAVVAAIALLAVLGFVMMSRKRSTRRLQQAFGSEYGRAVSEQGRTKAEKELLARKDRFDRAQVRELSDEDRRRYTDLWHAIQNRFVDSPPAAVNEADQLVAEVMRMRGYPAGDLDQRLADVAIGHPGLVDHYRSACTIADHGRGGRADTEEMRQALVHYRALFEELLAVGRPAVTEPEARPRFRAKHA